MTTDYAGIDYGMGHINKDLNTGFRFGVINQNYILQAWADESEPVYPDLECDCGLPIDMDNDSYTCKCGEEINPDMLYDLMEPIGFAYSGDGYECDCVDGDVFVTKSPYYTYAQFCSPCAPGACSLSNPLSRPIDDNKCYCFGHDWFDDGKAPYPVYSVETRELVND